jgi:hypothetical protein
MPCARRNILAMVVLGLAFALSACSRAGMTGGAMMRVEVDVYKGPIGQSHEVQIGELSALLAETVKGLRDWQAMASRIGYPEGNSTERLRDKALLAVALSASHDITLAICRLGDQYALVRNGFTKRQLEAAERGQLKALGFPSLYNGCDPNSLTKEDVQNLATLTRPLLADSAPGAKPRSDEIVIARDDYSRRVSIVASQMRLLAYRFTDANIGYVPRNKEVRYALASLSFEMTELAGMIASRTSILQKALHNCSQTGNCPYDSNGSKLPTSEFLRDVEPSAFMEAYDWFNADLDASHTGAILRKDRTRAIRALTEDYYWEKVNEVYASGQGDVAMAFIKDELGNWNLKSFSNDPTKLLAAYRTAASAALKGVTDIARKAVGDPSAIAGRGSSLLNFADRLATGEAPSDPAVGGLNVRILRERTIDRLGRAKALFVERRAKLFGDGKDGGGKDYSPSNPAVSTELETSRTEKTIVEGKIAPAKAAFTAADSKVEQDLKALTTCIASGGDCSGQRMAYDGAVANREVKRADLATLELESRKAADAYAVKLAEANGLSDRAATAAEEMLTDYADDLFALQAATASEKKE